MLGKIFLVLYVIVQIAVSVLTEFVIERNRFYKGFVIKTRVIRIIIYGLLALIPFLGAYLPASSTMSNFSFSGICGRYFLVLLLVRIYSSTMFSIS